MRGWGRTEVRGERGGRRVISPDCCYTTSWADTVGTITTSVSPTENLPGLICKADKVISVWHCLVCWWVGGRLLFVCHETTRTRAGLACCTHWAHPPPPSPPHGQTSVNPAPVSPTSTTTSTTSITRAEVWLGAASLSERQENVLKRFVVSVWRSMLRRQDCPVVNTLYCTAEGASHESEGHMTTSLRYHLNLMIWEDPEHSQHHQTICCWGTTFQIQ